MMGEDARNRIEDTTSSSFAADLKKWLQIMEAYEGGGHAYHATMPTDAIVKFHQSMTETDAYGPTRSGTNSRNSGDKVRALMASYGFQKPRG